MAVIAADQVVDFRDAARGRVFNGQDAVLDFVVLDGHDDILEMDIVHFDLRHAGEIVFQGLVAEGALHALVAYADGVAGLLPFADVVRQDIDLQVAAHGHDLLHDLLQLGRIGFVVQAPDGLGDDLEFPFPVEDGHLAGIFIGSHVAHGVEARFQCLHQRVVEPVDFRPQLFQIRFRHNVSLSPL